MAFTSLIFVTVSHTKYGLLHYILYFVKMLRILQHLIILISRAAYDIEYK